MGGTSKIHLLSTDLIVSTKYCPNILKQKKGTFKRKNKPDLHLMESKQSFESFSTYE
jgi:hypothetical protein